MSEPSALTKQMASAVKQLIGDVYVDDYYYALAADFVGVAIMFGAKWTLE